MSITLPRTSAVTEKVEAPVPAYTSTRPALSATKILPSGARAKFTGVLGNAGNDVSTGSATMPGVTTHGVDVAPQGLAAEAGSATFTATARPTATSTIAANTRKRSVISSTIRQDQPRA